MDRRRAIHALGLAAVLLIAAALRFTHLGAFGMAPDEDVTLQIAVDIRHAHWDLDAVTSDDLHDHFRDMPVSYYMTAALIDPDAPSLFAARLLFALTGIAAVLLLYGFAREAAGPDTALVAALFLALSPTAIQYAQTARYVGPSMATAIAIAWTATRAMARPNAVRLSVAAAVALLGVATNLLTLILFPLIALWVLIAWRRRTDSPLSRRLVWGTVIALAVAAAVIVVLVLPFARSWFVENLRFIHHPLATKLARTARFGASTIGRIGPLVFALGLFGAWRLIREKSVPGQIAALFAFGPLACLAALSLLVYTPYRYAILAFPFVYLAAAIFVVYLADARRVAAWGVGAAVCLSLAFATGQYLKDGDGRNGLRDAYRFVAERYRPGEVLATTSHGTIDAQIYGVPAPPDDQVLLYTQQGSWLDKYPDRAAWVVLHSSFDPAYQRVQVLIEKRCRHRGTVGAATRYSNHWVEIHRCWPVQP